MGIFQRWLGEIPFRRGRREAALHTPSRSPWLSSEILHGARRLELQSRQFLGVGPGRGMQFYVALLGLSSGVAWIF